MKNHGNRHTSYPEHKVWIMLPQSKINCIYITTHFTAVLCQPEL